MTYKWRMQLLSNDAKRMYAVVEEGFIPYPGLALRGYVGEHEVKVQAVVYDRNAGTFRVSIAWMSADIPDSAELMQYGWQKIVVQQPPQQPG